MKRSARIALLLAVACGSPAPPAPVLVASGAGGLNPMFPDGGWVDPCTLINDRNHLDVLTTALVIDNTDSRCQPPRYVTQGQTTLDSLPIYNNKLGPCPITYAPMMRLVPDGGLEPTCQATAACAVQFTGGDTAQSYDLLFDVYGTFRGTQEAVSTGQLCPYVKLYSNNTGLP